MSTAIEYKRSSEKVKKNMLTGRKKGMEKIFD